MQENFQEGDGGAVRWQLDCDMIGPEIATRKGPGELCGRFCIENR